MSASIPLAIGCTSVRQFDGLYSLNDLHRASGGEAKHQPPRFMRLDQTKALIAELGHYPEMGSGETPEMVSGVFQIVKGSVNPGTWVCRELVIAYAAWISAAFHLKVIRVFLGTIDRQPEPPTALGLRLIDANQAQLLREAVADVVSGGVQGYGETWARMHRKFVVNSYHQLPSDRFYEALNYIRSMPGYRGPAHTGPQSHVSAVSLLQPDVIDPAALLLEGQSDPQELTGAQRAMVEHRAWQLAGDAHLLIRAHIERRIAFRVHKDRRTDENVRTVVEGTTLGNALTHHYGSELRQMAGFIGYVQHVADQTMARYKAEMGRLGVAGTSR